MGKLWLAELEEMILILNDIFQFFKSTFNKERNTFKALKRDTAFCRNIFGHFNSH